MRMYIILCIFIIGCGDYYGSPGSIATKNGEIKIHIHDSWNTLEGVHRFKDVYLVYIQGNQERRMDTYGTTYIETFPEQDQISIGPEQNAKYFLYVDPAKFSREEFEEIANTLNEQKETLRELMKKSVSVGMNHSVSAAIKLGAVRYVSLDKLKKIFINGSEEIHIDLVGNVHHYWNIEGLSGGPNAGTMMDNGTKIFLNTPSYWQDNKFSPEMDMPTLQAYYEKFKDSDGKKISEYFEVVFGTRDECSKIQRSRK